MNVEKSNNTKKNCYKSSILRIKYFFQNGNKRKNKIAKIETNVLTELYLGCIILLMKAGGDYMDLTEIGFRIKSYRERNNIKQADLAKELGLTISALSKIEAGKQKVDGSTLIAYLNISKEYEEFFDITEDWAKLMANHENERNGLFNQLSNFCREYPSVVLQEFAGHEVGRLMRHELPLRILEGANLNTDEYKAYGSVGIGTWAKVPWIAFLDRAISDTVQKGIYVTYLFRGDGKGFYLSLNQGYAFFQERYGDESKIIIDKVTKYLRSELRTIDEKMNAEAIDLGGDTSLISAYESAHIIGKYYDANEELQEGNFIEDFKSIMLTYKEVCGLLKGKSYEAFIESIVNFQSIDFSEEIENDNFIKYIYLNTNHKDYVADFITEIDGKRAMFEMKAYNVRPRKNAMIARQSMEVANYRCEYDPEHETFDTNNGKPYVEVHHLIPIKEQDRFNFYLDNSANIVVLCPNCHKAIHMGSDEVKEKMLRKLFYPRAEKLESKGIELTFSQLKEMYGLKD